METVADAHAVLDREFLDIRARLLDLAAHLDRLDRASGSVADDARVRGIRAAIEILGSSKRNRAEQVQLIFSRQYEPDWKEKFEIGQD